MTVNIAIIGGGAIGVSCAYELARRGTSTVLLERETSVGRGASYGTACLITTAHAERLANPSALREAATFLTDPAGPLALRPHPRLLPWLSRFAWHSLQRRAAHHGTALLRQLGHQSRDLHSAWATSLDTGLVANGLLDVWTTPTGMRQRLAALQTSGTASRRLDNAELCRMEPALHNTLSGVLYPDEAHVDSAVFCQRVASAAAEVGASIRLGVEVLRLRPDRRGVSIDTTSGPLRAETVVVCNGADAPRLSRDIRCPLPIVSAKGYHVEFASLADHITRPVFLTEARVVATPLTGRLRLAGTLEFGTDPGRVDPRRVEAIIRAGATVFPAIASAEPTSIWRGARPVTVDGLPIIGRVPRNPRVIVAVGHAMLGISLAPVTASLVASIIAAESQPAELDELSPSRFRF